MSDDEADKAMWRGMEKQPWALLRKILIATGLPLAVELNLTITPTVKAFRKGHASRSLAVLFKGQQSLNSCTVQFQSRRAWPWQASESVLGARGKWKTPS